MLDAIHFYEAGLKLFHGLSPYSGDFAYPAVVAYLMFAILWMPVGAFQFTMLLVNALALIRLTGRRAPLWILYGPVFSVVLFGQWDLIIILMARSLKDNYRSALMAALCTLKPQLAIVLLPPTLWRWRRSRFGAAFLLFTGALWGLPLVVYPHWVSDWVEALRIAPSGAMANSPSLWAVLGPWALPICAALGLALWRRRRWSIPAAQLILPTGAPYSVSIFTGTALWIIPLSWIPFLAGNFFGSQWLIPLCLLAAEVLKETRLTHHAYPKYTSPVQQKLQA